MARRMALGMLCACLVAGLPLLTATAAAQGLIVGSVYGPDGEPARDALVITSAGGQAAVAADGSYEIAFELPGGADAVQVTAVSGAGTGSLVASARVAVLPGPDPTRAQPLLLEAGTGCRPGWLPTFGQQEGISGSVQALAVFDDGSGPALYVAGDGSIQYAGGVPVSNIARWDGTTWSALGSGLDGGVYALLAFDDGGGPALYAGGLFVTAGGTPASHVARWDGSSWSALGSGTNGLVQALAVVEQGGSPVLCAGGFFTTAGDAPAKNVATWNGTTWSPLGSELNDAVTALVSFDSGSGPELYASGFFSVAGGGPGNRIARWNGSTWLPVGAGVNDDVLALVVYDDGSGPALYAGGRFSFGGGAPIKRVAKWNGHAWLEVGGGVGGVGFSSETVNTLAVFDDGSGPVLCAGGYFGSAGATAALHIATWDGTTWSSLGNGMSGEVNALAAFGDDHPVLCAGGDFFGAGDVQASKIAQWDDSAWSPLGSGLDGEVDALAVFDDGSGPALYAGGQFHTAGGVAVPLIARWNGGEWSPLGSGMDYAVLALAVFDDGSGAHLYAGGEFLTAGGVTVNGIAKWDGSNWVGLANGMSGSFPSSVHALVVFDDGGGPDLYVSGSFTKAGTVFARNIARWDGTAWSPLHVGLAGAAINPVEALVVFDDGSGPALYAGGQFTTAGGQPANSVARWSGTTWSPLGSGLTGGVVLSTVKALAVFDDGSGPALYAGGNFTTAGGQAASCIARWKDSAWSAVGGGVTGPFPSVTALTTFDDGGGTALYVGGQFSTAGPLAANSIAKWDGASWSALGSGANGRVLAFAVHDDGSGPGLFAGGGFMSVPDSLDSWLAKWGCAQPPPAWTDLGGAKPGSQGTPSLVGTGSLQSDAIVADDPCTLVLTQALPSTTATLVFGTSLLGAPFKGGTLVPQPLLLITLPTDAAGGMSLPFELPAGVPVGTALDVQFWISDPGAGQGLSASNGLQGLSS